MYSPLCYFCARPIADPDSPEVGRGKLGDYIVLHWHKPCRDAAEPTGLPQDLTEFGL